MNQGINFFVLYHLAPNDGFNQGGQNRLPGIVVDHIDDLGAGGVRQLVKVIAVLLIEYLFGDVQTLRSYLFHAGSVVGSKEDFFLVVEKELFELILQGILLAAHKAD